MNPTLSEYARQRAAALEAKRTSLSFGGALGRAIGMGAIFIYVLWIGVMTSRWGMGMERGVGLYLMLVGSNYLAVAMRMWYSRLVLGEAMHWSPRPAPWVVALTWVGATMVFLTLMPHAVGTTFGLRLRIDWSAAVGLFFLLGFWAFWLAVLVLPALWIANRRRRQSGFQIHVAQTRDVHVSPTAPAWALHVGTATGYCRSRNDERGMFAGDDVALSVIDTAKGCVIAGTTGTGKTTLMRSFARQVSSLTGTALVAISAKPADAVAMASMFISPLILGPGHVPFALFAGLSPEAIGAAFGSLTGDPRNPFWRAAVSNLVCAWMQICTGLSGATIVIPEQRPDDTHPGRDERVLSIAYSPRSLSDLIYAPDDVVSTVLTEAARRLPLVVGPAHAQLAAGLEYFSGEYQATLMTARGETLGSVRASVSPFLRALCAPGLAEAFGSGEMDLSAAIDDGRAIIVDINAGDSPRGFDVASSLIMAHLKQAALARTARDPSSNNPCVVLVDEFGSYASTDYLPLFETARQARIACVVSIIGLSNLEARLGQAAAFAIPSAFGSMITFATGDSPTRKYVSERIGSLRSLEIADGSSSSPHPHMMLAPFVQQQSSSSSDHYVTAPIIEDAAWNNLGVRTEAGYASAIAILAQGGGVTHDVIMVHE